MIINYFYDDLLVEQVVSPAYYDVDMTKQVPRGQKFWVVIYG